MTTNWIKAIALADVPDEDVIAVQAGDREIAHVSYTHLDVYKRQGRA